MSVPSLDRDAEGGLTPLCAGEGKEEGGGGGSGGGEQGEGAVGALVAGRNSLVWEAGRQSGWRILRALIGMVFLLTLSL